MLQFRNPYLITITLFLILSGCESEFKVNDKGLEKIVLLSNINPDSIFRVHISSSNFIEDSTFTIDPTNPDIQLFSNDEYLGQFIPDRQNKFTSTQYIINKKPCPGCSYSIKAKVDDLDEILTTTSLPRILKDTEHIILKHSQTTFQEYYGVSESHFMTVKISSESFNNEPNSYYHIKVWKEDIGFNISNGDTLKYSNGIYNLNFNLHNDIPSLELFHEDGFLIDGNNLTSQEEDGLLVFFQFETFKDFTIETPIFIEIRLINEDYFRFHKSLAEQERNDINPTLLTDQSISIYNNVENGLGNFSGYVRSIESIIWY